MNADTGRPDEDIDDDDVDDSIDDDDENTIVLDTDDYESLDATTAGLNIEELVAIAGKDDSEARRREARKRLDEIAERRKELEDLGDTYNINLDDEL